MARRSHNLLAGLVLAGGAAAALMALARGLAAERTFTGPGAALRLAPVAARRAAGATSRRGAAHEDYPELSRVEDLIYDSCALMDAPQGVECLRTLDKLTRFHQTSQLECSLDELHCVVLDVLDRLCIGIHGRDGLILLNRVSNAVLLFREKFPTWREAFKQADKESNGHLTLKDLKGLLRSVNAGLSDSDTAIIFRAADANDDGMISAEEFSNFLTAAVFAEEPLRGLQLDGLPVSQPSLEEYVHWSTSGRAGGSWAGLSSLVSMPGR